MSRIGLFILFACYSNVLTLLEDKHNELSSTKPFRSNLDKKDNNLGDIDYEERKQIVKKYLEELNNAEDSWVDPHDMLAGVNGEFSTTKTSELSIVENKLKPVFNGISREVIVSNSAHKDETDSISNESKTLISKHRDQICIPDGIFISRWLKMLIKKIESDTFLEPNALFIPLDYDSVSKLKTMSTETVDIKELDEIVSDIISKATVTSGERYSFIPSSSYFMCGMYVIALGLFAYFVYIFLILRPIWTLLVLSILVSIFWHWMHLYQKAVAHHYAQLSSSQIPSSCRKNDYNFFESIKEYIKSYFVASDCEKYYEALMVDPVWEVSLSVAFSEAVSAMLLQPLTRGAQAVNKATKLLFDGLPLTSIVILVIFAFLLIIMYFNYRIKLPFFMGALEPGYVEKRKYIEDVKPYKASHAISDLVQKSVVSIEKMDRKISDLLQSELLHKDVNSDLSKKSDFKNICSNQGVEEVIQNGSQSEGHIADEIEKVEDNHFPKKLCDVRDPHIKNCNGEFIVASKDAFIEDTNFDCETNVQQQNMCYEISEKNETSDIEIR